MNIPPFMIIWADPSEVNSLLDESRPASCYCCDPQVCPFLEAALHLCLSSSLKDTDWSGACKADRSALFGTFPNHTPLGFLYPRAVTQWTTRGHSAPLLLSSCLSRRFGQARSSLARSLRNAEDESCKMAPRRKSETCARLSVSGVGSHFQISFTFWPCVDFGQTRKHAWRHAGGLRNECFVVLRKF